MFYIKRLLADVRATGIFTSLLALASFILVCISTLALNIMPPAPSIELQKSPQETSYFKALPAPASSHETSANSYLQELLTKNPKMRFIANLSAITAPDYSDATFSEEHHLTSGYIIFSAAQQLELGDAIVPIPGSDAGYNLYGTIPELTGTTFRGSPLTLHDESASTYSWIDGKQQEIRADQSGFLLAHPSHLEDFENDFLSNPAIGLEEIERGLICVCAVQEAEEKLAAFPLTIRGANISYTLQAVNQQQVFPQSIQQGMMSERLFTALPHLVLLSFFVLATQTLLWLISLRVNTFQVEEIYAHTPFFRVLRIEILVFISFSLPLVCGYLATEILYSLFMNESSNFSLTLLLCLFFCLLVHLATAFFYISYRKKST
ncbi:hypothetical protein [Rothia sp. ZJ1223]|uniref:hypothetical protein n=1 Tax=Rothia sp. ZJ1223 TaxID=2811098 RepID=UPI001958E645|nr:hypothetical protein [Rothia sp. ZJ1223]MBM7052009.1 hypothetical protein [Rothia sp. ZJ1223]